MHTQLISGTAKTALANEFQLDKPGSLTMSVQKHTLTHTHTHSYNIELKHVFWPTLFISAHTHIYYCQGVHQFN